MVRYDSSVSKESKQKHILVALAWPYANGSLHLGHTASFLGADVLARYHRLAGDKVLFVSGSDCYGTPIVVEAIKRGVSPDSVAEQYHNEFNQVLTALGFTYTFYTKTTTPEHARVVQDIFTSLYTKGYIYTKVGKALYSPLLNRFLPDRFVVGTCPHCGYADARGDQCDNCGALLDPLLLQHPHINTKILGDLPAAGDDILEVRESEHFYLKLSTFQNELKDWVASSADTWRVNAKKITESFLEQGLQDRAITRDTDWGIPVPLDGYTDKRLYVWFDAILGYLSASKHFTERSDQPEYWDWRQWWQNPDAVHYYVHGKDNVPFHTIILPAILKGVGDLHLPDKVFASEYLSLEGNQFSTSKAHAVWVHDFLKNFDSELIRYFLIAQGPETSDIDFRWSEFGQLVNGELIGTFGNLVNRVCTFAEVNFPDGVSAQKTLDAQSEDILTLTEQTFDVVGECITNGRFRRAFRKILEVAEQGNQFMHAKEPWKTIETDSQQVETDLLVLLHTIRSLAILIQPFLPKTSDTIQSFFVGVTPISSESDSLPSTSWSYMSLPTRITISHTRPLFKKVEADAIDRQKGGGGSV